MSKKQSRKILAGALSVGMLLSQGQAFNVFAESPFDVIGQEGPRYNATTNINTENILNSLTPEQREALKNSQSSGARGLQLSQNVNLDSEEVVSVIVEFKNKPQKVAVLEAAAKGKTLSADTAKNNAEADHATFKKDLTSKTKGTYKVNREYKSAFNGVSLQVPANKLKDLVKSAAVKAIYSNEIIKLEEPIEATFESNGQGMAAERSYLNVDKLHKEGFTGKGVKVAVLDTGIDYNHPDLKDVFKGGFDFIDNDADPMETTYADWVKAGKPNPANNGSDYVTEHGTHVSGTIAGQGTADSEFATTGVAPDVDLYVYRVLGPQGGTSESVIGGIDKAVEQGMDVINLSLGAAINHPLYPTSIAIDNAVLSGVTAVVAAGNEGNEMYTLGSPGTSPFALTIGASDVPTTIPTMKGHNDSLTSDMKLLARGYNDDLSTFIGKTFSIVNVPGIGQASDYKNIDVTNKVALVQRGTNGVNEKVAIAKQKGAAAVLVYNNVEGYMPFYLAEGGDYIPAFNMTMADGLAIKQQIASGKTTFTFSDLGQETSKGDELASFSSRGPSYINYDIKPEVVAPGVSVLSTVPGFIHNPDNPSDFEHAYDRMSGTSMATPFTTGVAALMLQAKPDAQPEDVKVTLMNTADPLKGGYSVFEQGAGRVNPYEAVHSAMEIKVKDETPTGINNQLVDVKETTGALSFGKEFFIGKDVKDSRTLKFENNSSKAKTFDVSVSFQTNLRGSKDAEKNGVTVTTDKTVRVPANSNISRKVDLFIPASAEKGIYEGYVVYTNQDDPAESYRLPFGVKYIDEGFKNVTHIQRSGTSDRNNLTNPLFVPYFFTKFTLKSHIDWIDVVLTDVNGKGLGITNSYNGFGREEDKEYTITSFGGYIYPFVNEEETQVSSKAALVPEGHYKLKLIGYGLDGATFIDSQDIFIDNTMPDKFDFKVEGEKEGNPFVEYKEGQQTIGLTASIHDKNIEVMKEAGIPANQGQNQIRYSYDNPFGLNGQLKLDDNGNVSDAILMNPNKQPLNVYFMGGDQAGNAYGKKQYYFVKDTTPYVFGSVDVKTRLNQAIAHSGDEVKVTLHANNVQDVSEALFNFDVNTTDTNVVRIDLNPAAQALGGHLTRVTTTPGTGTTVKSEVNVAFDQNVSGDIPMVDVTIKIADIKDPAGQSSFASVTSTITSQAVTTKPFTYVTPITILPNFITVKGYHHAEGFLNPANGQFDSKRDYTTHGIKVTIQDKQGKTYPITVNKGGQFYATGIPLTRDEMTLIQDIPGHFTTFNKFNDEGNHTYKTMDGIDYGYLKTLGTETVDTAIGGDVNKDNVIDIYDALAIQTAWGTNNRNSDINFDGTVDAKDFSFVERNFGIQNPWVTNAPKVVSKYKSKTVEDIKKELKIQ
ncbi:S8 family serine peptidase [Neobacillus sp. MER 74]|uniref:S8 family serine peptidase n=1 Tax=Neobacillus sp. MER 74 TaxID=2939566 RepID=UPI00203F8F33|nr:S8 family serine peptidase [Neobacillus sp. MER 74]MCM3113724.1 S8 family serine peptidase [Neobacillus sp. MER 74]